jgi:hypothetical protein
MNESHLESFALHFTLAKKLQKADKIWCHLEELYETLLSKVGKFKIIRRQISSTS